MTDKSIELDKHRGNAAQRQTALRLLDSAVVADQASPRQRQAEVERVLLAGPAESWPQAMDKVP